MIAGISPPLPEEQEVKVDAGTPAPPSPDQDEAGTSAPQVEAGTSAQPSLQANVEAGIAAPHSPPEQDEAKVEAYFETPVGHRGSSHEGSTEDECAEPAPKRHRSGKASSKRLKKLSKLARTARRKKQEQQLNEAIVRAQKHKMPHAKGLAVRKLQEHASKQAKRTRNRLMRDHTQQAAREEAITANTSPRPTWGTSGSGTAVESVGAPVGTQGHAEKAAAPKRCTDATKKILVERD